MELSLEAPDALVRPWRTAAFVAGAIALVELLLLLVIGGGALARIVSHKVERVAKQRTEVPTFSPTQRTTHEKASPAKHSRAKTKVMVLNGNGRQGAAASAAERVHRRGYRIGDVANAPRSDYRRSIVMYRPGFAGEGRRLGRDLHISLVTPLDGLRVRQLHGAKLVLILGA